MKKAIIIAALLALVSNSALAETKPAEPGGGDIAAAVISNFAYIPGKTSVCILSTAIWTVGMSISAGFFYKEMGDLVHGSCTGKWVLRGKDFMGGEESNKMAQLKD